MKQFFSFVQKEFYHIFRDGRTLLLLLLMPIVLMILFGFAITTEIKNNNIAIFDQAHDAASQNIMQRFSVSPYFKIESIVNNASEIESIFKTNKAALIIVIPSNFNKELIATNKAQVQIIADGTDPNTATSLIGYASSIISEYQMDVMKNAEAPLQIVPEIRMMYNPELKGAFTFVPGVMGLILMLITAMMTSVSIVKEIELGNMEVLLVSPLKPITIILAKAVPYLIIGFINVLTILILSTTILELPIRGNIFLLLSESMLFIITCLSLGLLISTVAKTQQVALLISLLGLMLPTMLFSGFIFPIANMPKPLQVVSNIVPATWFIIIVKAVMLKGLGIISIWKENAILLGLTVFFLVVSIRRFKIRL